MSAAACAGRGTVSYGRLCRLTGISPTGSTKSGTDRQQSVSDHVGVHEFERFAQSLLARSFVDDVGGGDILDR